MNNLEHVVFRAGLVADFIMDCIREHPERAVAPYPTDDFGYAKELLDWEADDKPSIGFYGTEDPLLLSFAPELKTKFGLDVVTMKKGDGREECLRSRISTAFLFPILSTELPGETV